MVHIYLEYHGARKMKWHLCLVISVLITSLSARADEQHTTIHNPPLVEVYHAQDSLSPYKERRADHGFMISINSENFLPKNYISTLDNSIYTDLYEESPIAIMGVEFSYKYNFSMGSMGLGLGYGMGSISSNFSGEERELSITRPFGSATYIMDNLFSEPYVAPYAELKVWQISVEEKSPTDKFDAQTDMGFTYSVGALIQLNILDQDASEGATHNYGLENTYLDVFMAKTTQTQGSEDADTESDFSFGAGIRLEF